MKNYRLTIILLIVFATLIGYYLYLNNVKPYEATKEIFGFKKGSITEIVISTTKTHLKFQKHGNHWTMVEPSSYQIDQEKLNSFEDQINHLSTIRMIAKDTNEVSRYGLEKPNVSITVKSNNDKTSTLLIGAETASKTEYYAMKGNQKVIYTVNKSDIDGFKVVPSDFRDRNLLTITPDFITTLSMIAGLGPEFRLNKGNNGRWQFVLPVRANVKGKVLQEILGMVMSLKIQEFISDKTALLERYGLERPSCTLAIGDKNGKVQTIYFGKTDPSKRSTFIKINGSDEIYTVSSDLFRPDNLDMGRLFDVAPLSIGIGDVNKIEIMDKGRIVQFSREVSKQPEDIFTIAKKPINSEDFNSLYVNIMSLTSAGYDSGNKAQAIELSVLFELKGDKKIKAEFSRRDNNSYFITVDGRPLPFYIEARKIELVRKWLQRVYESKV
jgi:hypothetical protein